MSAASLLMPAAISHGADNFDLAETLGLNAHPTVSNATATNQVTDPEDMGFRTLWFRFTAPAHGIVHLTTVQASPMSVAHRVGVFRGPLLGSVTRVDVKEGAGGVGTTLSFPVQSQAQFRICLGVVNDVTADVKFVLTMTPWPHAGFAVVGPPVTDSSIAPNDLIENALVLPAIDLPMSMVAYLASSSSQQAELDMGAGSRAVWYKWTSSFTGPIKLSTPVAPNAPGFAHRLGIYERDAEENLVTILQANSPDDGGRALLNTTVTEGKDYWISLGFHNATSTIPFAEGEKSAVVLLESGGVPPPVAVPEIDIRVDGKSLKDGGGRVSFGKVKLGKKSAWKTFTIANLGTANLTGVSIGIDGKAKKDFQIEKPKTSTLAGKKSTTFRMRMQPTATGTRTAAIHIKSNDANESPYDLTVTGTGAKK